ERVVVSAGNLIELKGHDLVIEAAATLPDVTLLIAGEGPERGRLEALTHRLGVADRVRMLGSVPQEMLIELYGAADVLVLASRSEGSPNVVLEALACGTPVVTTVPSAVPEGPAAADVAVVERTPAALARGIRQSLAAALDRSGVRERALSLRWDSTCELLLKLFATLTSAPSAAAA